MTSSTARAACQKASADPGLAWMLVELDALLGLRREACEGLVGLAPELAADSAARLGCRTDRP